jgi:mono/diheme cytochrome c family protein
MNEPIALATVPEKPLLLVAHHRPAGQATADAVAAGLSVIDIRRHEVVKEISLPNGSTGVRGLTLSPDGKYAYITHTLGHYQLPTTQLERGWMNVNALSVIDMETMEWFNTVLLDDLEVGAANPWGVKVNEEAIVVAHAGTHEISVIDRHTLHCNLEAVSRGDTVAASASRSDVPDDLTFLLGYRKRIPLTGNGPRAIDLSGDRIAVACYFSNSVEMINLKDGSMQSFVGANRKMNKIDRGEMLFNDANLCFQRWQSCASCHPDARTDGLNWDLMNDGTGNPKNTKSMLFAHVTPPAMITGIRPNAEYAVRSGIRFIQFMERSEQDAACIDAYLKSLRPIESPYLVKGKLSEAAQRGKAIFRTAQCTQCHRGKYGTDMKLHDTGIADYNSKGQLFDTPTLCELWHTAPYLYDGRAASVQEMINNYNREKKHGDTGGLRQDEINDLCEYILSL